MVQLTNEMKPEWYYSRHCCSLFLLVGCGRPSPGRIRTESEQTLCKTSILPVTHWLPLHCRNTLDMDLAFIASIWNTMATPRRILIRVSR